MCRLRVCGQLAKSPPDVINRLIPTGVACFLAQLLDVCTRLHPEHFGTFTPQTWWVGKSWPAQLKRLRAFCEREGAADTPFIVKPDSGCQGAGITLVRGHEELSAFLRGAEAPERAVVQVGCALRSRA